jgi:acetyl esterase/lipase
MNSRFRPLPARLLFAVVFALGPAAPAALHAQTPRTAVAPAPTLADVAYGPAPRNVLDFWRAKSDQPTPVVIYIHGGGFISEDKSKARGDKLVQQCLDAGVSFAAINYRYLSPAAPLQDVLRDCARAVQFIRSKSAEWNIDKTRVAAYGSSAGAGTSLWLAFHDDLADPKNADPVLRESTRLVCAGAMSPQATYDWLRWDDLLGADNVRRFGGRYNSPALYGLAPGEDLRSPAAQKVRADLDMLALITKDDPPVFVSSSLPDLALTNSTQFLHHPRHGQALYDRCREVGVPVVANIPALGIAPPADGPKTWRDFLFRQLGIAPATPARRAASSAP